jgi:hypothetical protein
LRKSEALFGLKRFDESLKALKEALALEPTSLLLQRKYHKSNSTREDRLQGLEIHQLAIGKELGQKSWFTPVILPN